MPARSELKAFIVVNRTVSSTRKAGQNRAARMLAPFIDAFMDARYGGRIRRVVALPDSHPTVSNLRLGAAENSAQVSYPARKQAIHKHAEIRASSRAGWIKRNRYFNEDHYRYLRFLIPENSRVLDLGCGIGDALAALKPSYGIGVDISGAMVAEASARHPELTFVAADIEDPDFVGSINGPFDYLVVSEAIGLLDDC